MRKNTAPTGFQSDFLKTENYLNLDRRSEMIKDIRHGMRQHQKCIPSKYFYDARGSEIFEEICCTAEYYLTMTELSILEKHASEIMEFFSEYGGDLVELGNGSNAKIRMLFDALSSSQIHQVRYIPVDISEDALTRASVELSQLHEGLTILGIIADFTRHLRFLPVGRKLITFFGSTIGNFPQDTAVFFLQIIRETMTPQDRLLIGMDMVKPLRIIEAAYNDRQGITRAFNLNILANINKELNADFNIEDFEHIAFFNTGKEQVEMHLRSRRDMSAYISDLALLVDLKEGETIHTEVCRKFSRESATRAFKKAGLISTRWFTDPKGWFSLVELRAATI